MRWATQDMDLFLSAKEFVDTAVVPLIPISFASDIKDSVSMSEFVSLLSIPLERQFRGRMLVLPGLPYLKSLTQEKLITDVKGWEDELYSAGFKHVFFISSDMFWRVVEGELKGEFIWLPSIPLSGLDESAKNTILDNQVKQLLQLFMQKWQDNE